MDMTYKRDILLKRTTQAMNIFEVYVLISMNLSFVHTFTRISFLAVIAETILDHLYYIQGTGLLHI